MSTPINSQNPSNLYPQLPTQTPNTGTTSSNIPSRGFGSIQASQHIPSTLPTTNLFQQNFPSQMNPAQPSQFFTPQQMQGFSQLEQLMNSQEGQQQFAQLEQLMNSQEGQQQFARLEQQMNSSQGEVSENAAILRQLMNILNSNPANGIYLTQKFRENQGLEQQFTRFLEEQENPATQEQISSRIMNSSQMQQLVSRSAEPRLNATLYLDALCAAVASIYTTNANPNPRSMRAWRQEQQQENIVSSQTQQQQVPQNRARQPLSAEELNVSFEPLSDSEQSNMQRIFSLFSDESFVPRLDIYVNNHPQFTEKLQQRFTLYHNASCRHQDARRLINYFQNRGLMETLPEAFFGTTLWPIERKEQLLEVLAAAFEVVPLPTGESCFCRCWTWIKDYILDPIYRFFRMIFCCKPLSGAEPETDRNARINNENAQRINEQNLQVHQQMTQQAIQNHQQATDIANQMHTQTVQQQMMPPPGQF